MEHGWLLEELYKDLIVAKINIDVLKNVIVMIPRIMLNLSTKLRCPSSVDTAPNKSCFALTIRKAQGQTMKNVLIYLEKIQHGQLYVTLSWGKRNENIRVFLKNGRSNTNIFIKSFIIFICYWVMSYTKNNEILQSFLETFSIFA